MSEVIPDPLAAAPKQITSGIALATCRLLDVRSMPRSQAGLAAAIASTSRQVGTALGVAVMGSAVLSALHGPLRPGFAGASHVGWWIIAGCGAAVLLLAIVTTGRWAKATAARTASRMMPGTREVPVPSRNTGHVGFVIDGRAGTASAIRAAAPSSLPLAALCVALAQFPGQ